MTLNLLLLSVLLNLFPSLGKWDLMCQTNVMLQDSGIRKLSASDGANTVLSAFLL